jgi:hypothetical protein
MLEKSSIFMMILIVTGALLVGISSIIYQPANGACMNGPPGSGPAFGGCLPRGMTETKGPAVKPPITQQQEQKLLQLTPKVLGKAQQQAGITGTLVGKILTFLMYASSDGKACIVYATISTTAYYPNYPLGLKPGDNIDLLAPDQTMCILLGKANVANKEIAFRVALPAVTAKELPPYIQQNFPPKATYRAVLFYVIPS